MVEVCLLCDTPLEPQTINFVQDGKLWRVSILICKVEGCLVHRGGYMVEYKYEKPGVLERN